jgi:predicted permease
MRVTRWLETLVHDFRYAARMLRRSPAFTAAAVLSLALGIGATTMMFSVIHAVVLEPFPYRDPDTLLSVIARGQDRGLGSYYQIDDFVDIAERNRVFDGVIASTISDVLLTGEGEPERLRGNYVTLNTFDVMGVPPLIGRGSTADDGRPGATPIVVLSHAFWQRHFAGRPDILGRTLQMNSTMRTIVGVMPPRFLWRGADVYLPVPFERGHPIEGVPAVHLLGRQKPGVSRAQVEADLRPILTDIWRRHPELDSKASFTLQLMSFKEAFASGLRNALLVLLGAVGLLLLIACANVSNLLLARAGAREREIAIRTALGAGRGRVVRQLLTESLVLAIGGAALGVLLAYLGLIGILWIIPPDYVPAEADIALNRPVLQGTVLLGLLSAFLFGLAPALQTVRRDIVNPLRDAGRGVMGSGRQTRLRGILVITEVALAVVLLVGSGLLIRTLMNLQRIDTQIQPDRVLTMRVPLPPQRYAKAADRVRFFDELVERVSHVPGVTAVGASAGLPLYGSRPTRVTVSGQAPSDIRTMATEITPGYFRVVNAALVRGRLLGADDVSGQRHISVINQTFARQFFGDDDPIGRVVRLEHLGRGPQALTDDSVEIVGVVRDSLNSDINGPPRPELFLPHSLTGAGMFLLAKTTLPPLQIERAIRHEVYAIDKNQPVTDVRTMETLLNQWSFAVPRFNLLLLSIFAALGLTLATIGIYGVMAYTVSRQTQEFGIRMALGAQRADVVRMVLGSGLRLIGIGLAVGCVGAAAAMRLLASQIWGVSTYDPVSFALVIALLLFVGLQACLWPARRASRVDPMIALRDA